MRCYSIVLKMKVEDKLTIILGNTLDPRKMPNWLLITLTITEKSYNLWLFWIVNDTLRFS